MIKRINQDLNACSIFVALAFLRYLPIYIRLSKYLAVITYFHTLPPFFNFMQPIIDHIESYRPSIAQHRRAHAPNRLYLPSELDRKQLVEDFNLHHNPDPATPVSYATYLRLLR